MLAPVENRNLYTTIENCHEIFEYLETDPNDDTIQEVEEEFGRQVSKKQKRPDDVVEYIISMNMNSGDTDTTVRKGWYLVSFQYVSKFSMDLLANGNAIVNCINTALRGNMISHCVGFGRSPHMFFFRPPKEQEAILPSFLVEKLYNSIIPLLGLKQSVRYCADRDLLLLVPNFGIRYMYNDVDAKTREPFHVLQIDPHGNRQSATIATIINILNVHDSIPPDDRSKLENHLKKINFHVRYYKGGQYENKLRAQQAKQKMAVHEYVVTADANESTSHVKRTLLTDEQIEKKKYFLKINQRLLVGEEESIIWDPSSYTFPYVPKVKNEKQAMLKLDYDSALADKSPDVAVERQITVAEYFSEQYQLQLKYPKMPLIRVKSRHKNMKEYYPLEFLLQCPDEVKNINTDKQIQDGLKVGDEFCGIKRIKKISSLVQSAPSGHNPLKAFQNGQRVVLEKEFQLKLHPEPITSHASGTFLSVSDIFVLCFEYLIKALITSFLFLLFRSWSAFTNRSVRRARVNK